MQIDFSSLLEPRLDYADQVDIQRERVWKLTACAVYYNVNLGLVSRFLGGEYSVAWRDIDAILVAVHPHIFRTDFEHIERILRTGCPAIFHGEKPAENKELFICRSNNPSISKKWESTINTLNKEERYHHIIPFQRWVTRASLYAHHVPQTIIVK